MFDIVYVLMVRKATIQYCLPKINKKRASQQ